jgi:hypothetical protein
MNNEPACLIRYFCDVKERACYLASNPAKEETMETERVNYTLPDGSSLEIGPARYKELSLRSLLLIFWWIRVRMDLHSLHP